MLQRRNLPIGLDLFSKLIDGNFLFCDKSLLIKELIDRQEKLILITRPRRWGKTLNMSMLQYFFAASVCGRSTQGLFDNLKIGKADNGKYMRHQGQYPVIFITLKDIEESNFEKAKIKLFLTVQKLYDEFSPALTKSDHLTLNQRKIYDTVLQGTASDQQFENSIAFLSQLLYTHYQKRVYILIDEYDAPLTAANNHGYLNEMTGFMRNFFGAALKTNYALEKGVLTGILRISKDNMLSQLNNLKIDTILHSKYAKYFGFTEEEVVELFNQVQAQGNQHDIEEKPDPNKLHEMQSWYNGYKIGGITIYNPWSIVNYLGENCTPNVYWVNTGNTNLIKEALVRNDLIKEKVGDLVNGKTISVKINPYVLLNEVYENEQIMWSLLLFSGYLRAEKAVFDCNSALYDCQLCIPNQEIKTLYNRNIIDWFEKTPGRQMCKSFKESLLNGNAEQLAKDIGNFLLTSVSTRETGKKTGEIFYHGFFLGLTASLIDYYNVTSNRESGLGYYDVALLPYKSTGDLLILFEFKHTKYSEGQEAEAKNALKQIDDRHYIEDFAKYSHIKKVLKIGMAFTCKSVVECSETVTLEEYLKRSSENLFKNDSSFKDTEEEGVKNSMEQTTLSSKPIFMGTKNLKRPRHDDDYDNNDDADGRRSLSPFM